MNAHTSLSVPLNGSTVHLLGTLVTFRASAADTDGAFSLVEIAVAPGAGTPPHHHLDAESFLVLDGTVTFTVAGKEEAKGPGSFVHLPSGTAHAFRNEGSSPARMIGINMPGGPHAQFFAEAGEPVADASTFPTMSPPDVPKLIATAQRHGITILPPN